MGSTVAILCVLFAVQRFGTAKIGWLFSPVLLLWFVANAAIGVYNIVVYKPSILKAVSPHYGIAYLLRSGKHGWLSCSGIVLCITGSESLFADMGHFTQRVISVSLALKCACYLQCRFSLGLS